MTPKEASIEIEQAIELIYDAINRNTDDATWRDLNNALAHMRKVQSEFIAPLRTRAKPRHPPKVPTVPVTTRDSAGPPERYTEALASIRKAVRDIEYAPHVKSPRSISGGARPLGRLE